MTEENLRIKEELSWKNQQLSIKEKQIQELRKRVQKAVLKGNLHYEDLMVITKQFNEN